MQMYVYYYDRYQKQDFEKPTVGILLCKEKNDALVELAENIEWFIQVIGETYHIHQNQNKLSTL